MGLLLFCIHQKKLRYDRPITCRISFMFDAFNINADIVLLYLSKGDFQDASYSVTVT